MALLSSLLDFTKICRLCLSQGSNLTQIFSDTSNESVSLFSLPSKIYACVSIEVVYKDNLPDKICNRCLVQLGNWIKFKELCDNANTLLLQWVAETPAFTDEILKKTLRGHNKTLDIPETSSDISFADVSLLDHDSLLQKLDSKDENEYAVVHKSLSLILSECGNFQNNPVNKEESQKPIEKDIQEKESNQLKWREKYLKSYARKYYCYICPSVFTKFNSLLQHDKAEHKDIVPEEQCEQCSQIFVSKERLEVHNNLKHKEKAHECEICGFKSVSKKALSLHRVRHSGKFSCSVCGLAAGTRTFLLDHQKIHSNEKSYSCTKCQQTFKQRQSLEHHLKTHSNTGNQFKCNVCLKAFTNYRYFKNHKDSHKDNKEYVCEICGAVLKSKPSLHTHKHSHFKKQHNCDDCGKTFLTRNLLTRHLLVHSESSYMCAVCDKSFSRPDNLSLHMKTHSTSQKQIACELCGKVFSLSRYLQRHLKRVHNKVSDS